MRIIFALLASTVVAQQPQSDTPCAASESDEQSKIAFVSYRDDNLDIYVMNADGTGVTRLTSNAADNESPSFPLRQ